MKTNDDIETYLLQAGLQFSTPEEGMWIVHDETEHPENLVIYHSPPVTTFRIKLMEVPDGETRYGLYEKMLRMNAEEMVSGAYGIEGENIVLVDTLQSENLDFNEFQASIDGLSMAVSMHHSELSPFRNKSENTTDA